MSMKRLSPLSDCSDATEPPVKRTHRTHEENQERAYIAASRRADRNIEHRIRSALKASECRKKRTGRGLKITREAVMGDEQYESEDEDPTTRRFSLPTTTNLSNNSPPSYTMSRADRYAEVDALFAKHFPHVQLSSRWSTAQPPPQQQQQPRQQQPNYPQPLPLQPAYVPRYSQHDAAATAAVAAAAATIQPSPPPTPPMSYPLPPTQGEEDDEKPGSMSPLALEASQFPVSSSKNQLPATTTLNLSIDPPTTTTTTGGYHHLMPSSIVVDDEQSPPFQLITPIDFSADAAAWFGGDNNTTTTTTTTTTGGSASELFQHMRSLSLPSALEHFQFGSYGDDNDDNNISTALVVDPAMFSSDDPTTTALGVVVATPTPPNEPWSEWVDLDGDGAHVALGVEV
ncbi:hypothetical protein C8A00DRAFT_29389 [Chaetomidium leptoderma]|uniref:Uncharacterized protein n=1 Tax=Chaetomidium leptoderma TaxID=669021 RepID=A0AAN6VUK6_9PEZI|nr:hypothetical protein C8A00DRAFT_29389 [Chaetomidium leptoderma]